MSSTYDIAELKCAIRWGDDNLEDAAALTLAKDAGDEGVNYLIEIIGSSDARLRDIAARAIERAPDQRYLDPLLAAIFNPANKGFTSDMVYALDSLDCSKKLVALFDIAFYLGYHNMMYATMILGEHEFDFSDADLVTIREKWDSILKDPSLCPDFEHKRVELAACVDGFVSYLNE